MKLFLLIFLAIIFIPLPIKIDIFASTNNYYLKLYGFNILKKEKKEDINTKIPEINKTKKTSILKRLSTKNFIYLLKLLNKSKFKPTLRIKGYFSYSLGDAAKTAVFYGILHTFFPLLLFALNIIFKIKKFHLPIKPVYEDKFIAEFQITSIITLSFAQIIYISILLVKTIKFIKEVKLEREHI
jgi:hypothetical protein